MDLTLQNTGFHSIPFSFNSLSIQTQNIRDRSKPRSQGITSTNQNQSKFTEDQEVALQLADLGVVTGVYAIAGGQPGVGCNDTVVRSGDRHASPAQRSQKIMKNRWIYGGRRGEE